MELFERIKLPFFINEEEIRIEIFKTNMMGVINAFSEKSEFLDNQPGVYVFYEKDKLYIGESSQPFARLKSHIRNSKLNSKHQILVFRSDKFNKSAVYNIETKLIDYFAAEEKFTLINSKTSQGNHDYFLKELYENTIEVIWKFLLDEGLAKYQIQEIENMDLFKFSPYKDLNSDQTNAIEDIKHDKETKMFLIEGYPGTGKSIVASTLFNTFAKEQNVALIGGTPAIEKSFKNVFKRLKKQYKTDSIICRSKDVIKNEKVYDLIIVDEAHRLLRKEGKGHPGKYMHLSKGQNDLDELIKKTKRIIILYDENQTVHDGDFLFNRNKYSFSKTLYLREQMRATQGYKFINYCVELLNGAKPIYDKNSKYDARVYSNFSNLYKDLLEKSKHYNLTRIISGNSRPWLSKTEAEAKIPVEKRTPDFDIDGIKLWWNSDHINWFHSKAAKDLKEVAYYNTVQGFDLHYAGVIIGKDLYLDENGEIQVSMKYVTRQTELPKKDDPFREEKFRRWILNQYKILLSRGSKGTFIYAEDERLAKKLMEEINK